MKFARVNIWLIPLTAAMCMLTSCASLQSSKSKSHKATITSAQVPDAVKQALQSRFPSVTSTEWKMKQGNIYEAEFFVKGKEITVMFDASGKWIETEKAIEPASVPAAIMETVATRFKGYKVIETQDMQRFDKPGLLYELHLENSKQVLKILFSSDGAILKQSSKSKK